MTIVAGPNYEPYTGLPNVPFNKTPISDIFNGNSTQIKYGQYKNDVDLNGTKSNDKSVQITNTENKSETEPTYQALGNLLNDNVILIIVVIIAVLVLVK